MLTVFRAVDLNMLEVWEVFSINFTKNLIKITFQVAECFFTRNFLYSILVFFIKTRSVKEFLGLDRIYLLDCLGLFFLRRGCGHLYRFGWLIR